MASKPPVVQSFVAVADQASRPRPQAAVPEAAMEAQTTFSQVSVNSFCDLQHQNNMKNHRDSKDVTYRLKDVFQ